MKLVVPVADTDYWAELAPRLSTLVTALSGDELIEYEFVQCRVATDIVTVGQTTFFDEEGVALPLPHGHDELMLFSGGLDSLTGAVESLQSRQAHPILVSSVDGRSGRRAFRRISWTTCAAAGATQRIRHITAKARFSNREWPHRRANDAQPVIPVHGTGWRPSLRSPGLDTIRACENGVVGTNLPLSTDTCGTRATRTTHPEFMAGMVDLVSDVCNRHLRVELPYWDKTRAEVLGRLKRCGGAGLIRHSVSCAHPVRAGRSQRHCGGCTQCVDRRVAVWAAGLQAQDPDDGYHLQLMPSRLPPTCDSAAEVSAQQKKTLANYLKRTRAYAQWSRIHDLPSEAWSTVDGFVALNGRARDDVATDILQLHNRHAGMLKSAIDAASRGMSAHALDGRVPLLLALLVEPDTSEDPPLQADEAQEWDEFDEPSLGPYIAVSDHATRAIDDATKAALVGSTERWDLIADLTTLGDIDTCTVRVRRDGAWREVELGWTEWKLLEALVRSRGERLSTSGSLGAWLVHWSGLSQAADLRTSIRHRHKGQQIPLQRSSGPVATLWPTAGNHWIRPGPSSF